MLSSGVRLPATMADVFPAGCHLVPDSIIEAMDYDEATGRRFPAVDKHTGKPVFQCRVSDRDRGLEGRSREVVVKIVGEERGHQDLGEKIVVEQCQEGAYDDVKQPLFEKWLRLGLLSFGRPGTPGNRYAIEQGIKKRDSGACMKDFLDDIRPVVRAASLRFPDPASLDMELPSDLDWSS